MRLKQALLPLILAVLGITYISAVSTETQEFTGKVVGVTDGDTISVMHDGKAEKVRLNGIDCPEIGQDFGQRAKELTSGLCFGEVVTVKALNKDQYGRFVADVTLPDGRSLNQELVRTGLAWWYSEYSKDKTLKTLEAKAQEAKLGLWAGKDPVPPWKYRQFANSETSGDSTGTADSVKLTPAGIEAALSTKVTLRRPYPKGHKDARSDKITVQYAVIELAHQAGLGYNWEKSFENTDPVCRHYIQPNIEDETCSDALSKILDPVGLRYNILGGEIVLEKK